MKNKKLKEIHELTCDVCGKKIEAIDEKQADYNMRIHKWTHERQEKLK